MAAIIISFLLIVNGQTVSAVESSRCQQAVRSTKKMCNGVVLANYVINLLKAFESQKRARNIRSACEQAQNIFHITYVSNTVYALSCQKLIKSCKRACRDDDSIVCEDYEERVKLASAQAVVSAQSYLRSKACAKITSEKCFGGAASHPRCRNTLEISNVIPSVSSDDSLNSNLLAPLDLDDSAKNLYDYEGHEAQATLARVDTPEANSQGFNPGEGTSFKIDQGEVNTQNSEKIEKDILQGTREVSTGAAPVSGAWKQNAGTHESEINSDFNLKDFLPNGPKYKRGIASTIHPEVTPSNGLSNFQKITRKMNEMRPDLMP